MSQVTPVIEIIDGESYEIFMLAPMKSHHLLLDVSKMVGPSLGPILDGLTKAKGENILEKQVDLDMFTQVASSLFKDLDSKNIDNLINELKEVTHVDGKQLSRIFDAHFLGRLDVMYRWLIVAMKAQWGKSLSALLQGVSTQK